MYRLSTQHMIKVLLGFEEAATSLAIETPKMISYMKAYLLQFEKILLSSNDIRCFHSQAQSHLWLGPIY